MQEYPEFAFPEELRGRDRFDDWSLKDARVYFDWLIGVSESRQRSLLEYLGVEAALPDVGVLEVAGQRAAGLLVDPYFSDVDEFGTPCLSAMAGNSLAADLGLLTAHVILDVSQGCVAWEIEVTPRDASYYLPVLSGFSTGLKLNPILGSVGAANGVVRGRKDGTAWRAIADYWLARC